MTKYELKEIANSSTVNFALWGLTKVILKFLNLATEILGIVYYDPFKYHSNDHWADALSKVHVPRLPQRSMI